MKNFGPILSIASLVAALLWAPSSVVAQQNSGAALNNRSVPRLVNYTGVLMDAVGKPIAGVSGVTFLLYREAQGGAPLWMETQNVTADRAGRYTVQLGSTRNDGLPREMFATGEARWLGVQVGGQAEQARILLVAVPYAMKAADAETVGGLPASAFMLAAPAAAGNLAPASTAATTASGSVPPTASNVTTTGGTVNTIPLFATATGIQNSAITQTGSGATAKIGIGVATPAAALDIKGGEYVRGALTLPAIATASATKGANSQPDVMIASVFNGSTSTAVSQKFELQAEPANNNTATASGTLNLLYGSGTAVPAETGLKIGNNGQITFAPGQTFPGTGTGTVTSVGLTAPASDFIVSGSPVITTGTLNLAWTAAPTPANTPSTIVKRDPSGNFAAGTVTASTLSAGTVNATSAALTGELAINTAGTIAIDASSGAPNATPIQGVAYAATGSGWGVVGTTVSTASQAYGVVGFATASTGNPKGVYGTSASPTGVGVFGERGPGLSITGGGYAGAVGVGTWGDAGTASGTDGMLGTADDGPAGVFENNSTVYTLTARNTNAGGYPLLAYNVANGAFCQVDPHGNLGCTGTKTAIVPIDSGKRKVALSAIESPQNWFEDAGSAALVNGSAVVALDPDFIQTINTEQEYLVFPVPNEDCKGLYVTHKTATSFEVRELGGGTSSIRFNYRIMALRKNYENVRFADHTNDPDPRTLTGRMKSMQPPQPAPAIHSSGTNQ